MAFIVRKCYNYVEGQRDVNKNVKKRMDMAGERVDE